MFQLYSKCRFICFELFMGGSSFVLIEAGLGNLFVISSNCPNGPKEILNEGKNGLLFENDKKGALEKNFYEFINLIMKKLIMKKNLKKYF